MHKADSLAVFSLRKIGLGKRFGDSATLCSCELVSKINIFVNPMPLTILYNTEEDCRFVLRRVLWSTFSMQANGITCANSNFLLPLKDIHSNMSIIMVH